MIRFRMYATEWAPWRATMKILVVEDSERLRRSLGQGLSKANFTVDLAADGMEGLAYLRTYDYDVVVLDLLLPRMSGLEVLKEIRRSLPVHVIILSAKDQVQDRIRGLEMGADDYVVKPFDFDELCARIHALVRRRFEQKNPCLEVGPLRIDTVRREVKRGGHPIHLTPSEYKILHTLALRPGRTFSKAVLMDRLYRSDADVTDNVVEVLVSNLRKKIQSPDEPRLIVTRRGRGYELVPPDEG